MSGVTDKARQAELGGRIRKWREAKGMTQEQLSGLAVLTTRTIHLIESGATDTKVSNIYRIADVLHISPSVLIGEKDEEDSRWQELWMLWQRMTPSAKKVIYAAGKAMMEKMEQVDQRGNAC